MLQKIDFLINLEGKGKKPVPLFLDVNSIDYIELRDADTKDYYSVAILLKNGSWIDELAILKENIDRLESLVVKPIPRDFSVPNVPIKEVPYWIENRVPATRHTTTKF